MSKKSINPVINDSSMSNFFNNSGDYGQNKGNGCTLANFTFQPDTPSLRFHGQTAEGQAQPATAPFAAAGWE
jgi:hypothetical protein